VLAAALPGLLSSNTAQGLSWLSWVFIPLLALLAMLTLAGTPAATQRLPAEGRLLGELWRVLGDHRFKKLLTVFVINGIAAALPATLVLFFVADVLRAETLGGAFLALYFVSGILFLPIWVTLSRRFGRVPAWVASMLVAVAAFSWAWTLGAGLSLPLLDLVGYRSGVVEATFGLSAVYCLLPLFFKTIAAVLAWRWRHILESSS
ncbi:MAG: MFS transporter, partial [Rhodospirillaceae bacterium]|nr:MFS transporter [Rhodospirillaceae bacterium]